LWRNIHRLVGLAQPHRRIEGELHSVANSRVVILHSVIDMEKARSPIHISQDEPVSLIREIRGYYSGLLHNNPLN
jgi:hypothetical protein